MRSETKQGLGVIGVGAAACAVCCAGPVVAFLGGLSLAGFAGTALFGAVALVVAIPALAAFVVVRWRRTTGCTRSEPTFLDPPRRKAADDTKGALR